MDRIRMAVGLALIGSISVASCGSDNEELTGSGGGAGTSGTAGAGADAGVAGSGGWNPDGGISQCQGHTYKCGNLADDDGDGLIDQYDPDCLGPCDDTEESYYGGIPGQNNAPCKMDCYFDQDTGPGNDDCYWNHQCEPLAVAPAYPPEGLDQAGKPYCQYDANAKTPGTNGSCEDLFTKQSDLCMSYCGPLTPNGCDCFGCCELPAGGGKYVWLGSTVNGVGSCDRASLDDPARCEPCTPVQACLNGCSKCELCIGKSEKDIPEECRTDGGATDAGDEQPDGGYEPQCPEGVQPCGLEGQAPCLASYYCITGCCRAVPK